MPLPTPNKNETKVKFIDRCMGSTVMVGEYPEEDQRYAVCISQWEKSKRDDDNSESEPEIETRYVTAEFRIEKVGNAKRPVIAGYSAVFNKMSEDLGGFREKLQRGAFSNALKNSDPRALFNHNRDYVLGRLKAGTLKLHEDDHGLYAEIYPPDTQFARDLMVSIERGDITEQSFGFTIAKEEWDIKQRIRTVTEIDRLFDISPVTYAAYKQTDVAVALRSLRERIKVTDEMIGDPARLADRSEQEKLFKRIQDLQIKL